MTRIQKAVSLTVLLIVCGGVLSLTFLRQNLTAAPDTVALSRIVSEAALHWPQIQDGDYSAYGYDFSAADIHGRLFYQSSPDTAVSQSDALKRQDYILNVSIDGTVAGTLFISADLDKSFRQRQEKYAFLLFLAFVLPAIVSFLYFLYLEQSVLHPFTRLQDFAKCVAYGNLDIPLHMEKNNWFGAFTEAFDLMRTQLLEARERERLASESKKELVASLSHDLKTPVTSIKLLSELMLASGNDERDVQRLQIIYDKSEQIDRLLTDLFQASLEELGEMKINMAEVESSYIQKLIKSTDYDNRIPEITIPDCLILADPLRLEQVIGNLIMNSYKYAGTPIKITAKIADSVLNITFEDQGPGVSPEELPLLTAKFYRGKNTAKQPQNGAGLGLYISNQIMVKIGGCLTCRNTPEGFAVELLFSLA